MLLPQNWELGSTTSVRIKSQERYLLINSKEDTVFKFCINLNVAFHVLERNTCKFDENFAAKAVLGLTNFLFTDIFQHNSLDKIGLIQLGAFKIIIMKTSSH